MNGFRVGDTVMLKSGGPTMTVAEVNDNGSLFCIWFDGKNERKQNSFKAETLDHVEK